MDTSKAKKIIPSILKKLKSEQDVLPAIGIEQEFYLQSLDANKKAIIEAITQECYKLNQEKGWEQYECLFEFSTDVVEVASQVYEKRNAIKRVAVEHGACALFDAKPYTEDYGSALHIHISLHNNYGGNLYSDYTTEENTYLQHSIGGMLDLLKESLFLICENDNDFARFIPAFHAPVNNSWGGNNRTTALRIPDSAGKNKRVEYRIAPSDGDPYTVVMCALIGIYHGLTNKISPPERIYGDAAHPQYNLEDFPQDLEEAKAYYKESGVLEGYIKKFTPLFAF